MAPEGGNSAESSASQTLELICLAPPPDLTHHLLRTSHPDVPLKRVIATVRFLSGGRGCHRVKATQKSDTIFFSHYDMIL